MQRRREPRLPCPNLRALRAAGRRHLQMALPSSRQALALLLLPRKDCIKALARRRRLPGQLPEGQALQQRRGRGLQTLPQRPQRLPLLP